MDFKKSRVDAHNQWPNVVKFNAIVAFEERLRACAAPFSPVLIGHDSDVEYQKYVGHLIDGVESLPHRPDYMFDHCFKIIDQIGKIYFQGKGIKGTCQGIYTKISAAQNQQWTTIIDLLCQNIPTTVLYWLSKRLFDAAKLTDAEAKQLAKRVDECTKGNNFLAFLGKKFFYDAAGGCFYSAFPEQNKNKIISFLRIYLSGSVATNHPQMSTPSPLDLTQPKNILTTEQRAEVLLSWVLFVARNERAHGKIISPFRTSHASLERYQSYYYMMLVCYIFAIGAIQTTGKGGITTQQIMTVCQDNINSQCSFFA